MFRFIIISATIPSQQIKCVMANGIFFKLVFSASLKYSGLIESSRSLTKHYLLSCRCNPDQSNSICACDFTQKSQKEDGFSTSFTAIKEKSSCLALLFDFDESAVTLSTPHRLMLTLGLPTPGLLSL